MTSWAQTLIIIGAIGLMIAIAIETIKAERRPAIVVGLLSIIMLVVGLFLAVVAASL